MIKARLTSAFKQLITLTLMVFVLQGCGFQLRGDYLLSSQLQNIYLSSADKHGELTRLVKQNLLMNKVNVIKSFDQDIPELRILKDTLNRRTLSVFENGQVAEYELIYSVQYQLHFQNQEPKSFEIELNRDYQDDPSLALAKSRELTLMLSEMRQEAANRILRNLASIKL
jgi:LPS-assembly lipoprotein